MMFWSWILWQATALGKKRSQERFNLETDDLIRDAIVYGLTHNFEVQQ